MSETGIDTDANFILKSERAATGECNAQSAGLCCCEYIDRENKRYHILGCCCNCQDFDLVCTRFTTCKKIDSRTRNRMLLTFQDRLRIPWRGGAKQMSLEAVIPVLAVPFILALAAINVYTAVIMLISKICFVCYGMQMVKRAKARTRFFFMWITFSIIYMVALFELTVPLLELLPEENLILVILGALALFFLWRVRQLAPLNHVTQSTGKDELPGITEATSAEEDEEEAAQTALLLDNDDDDADVVRHQPNICSSCRKYMPPRTDHCALCGACIMRRDHHSYWLNCCIGEHNHRYYLAGLVFGLFALILGANLTLTAVCHPFLVFRLLGVPVMLPDDCSEVFDDYELSIAFVIAGYALLIAFYVLIALLRQIYLISRGTTMQECQRGHCGNRKTPFANWKAFIY